MAQLFTEKNGNEPALGGDLKLPSWANAEIHILNVDYAPTIMSIVAIMAEDTVLHLDNIHGHFYLYIEELQQMNIYQNSGGFHSRAYVRGKLYVSEQPLQALSNKCTEIIPPIEVSGNFRMENTQTNTFSRSFVDTYYYHFGGDRQ